MKWLRLFHNQDDTDRRISIYTSTEYHYYYATRENHDMMKTYLEVISFNFSIYCRHSIGIFERLPMKIFIIFSF